MSRLNVLFGHNLTNFLFVIILLTGCGSSSGNENLADTAWVMGSVNGERIEMKYLLLTFDEENGAGNAGCNAYHFGYSISERGELTVSDLLITEEYCHEDIMAQERAIVSGLLNATDYEIIDDRLEITEAGGETALIFKRVGEVDLVYLENVTWSLVTPDYGNLIEGTTITIIFESDFTTDTVSRGIILSNTGCHSFRGWYVVSLYGAMNIHYAKLEERTGCSSSELMDQEKQIFDNLKQAFGLKISGNNMEIATPQDVLVFESSN